MSEQAQKIAATLSRASKLNLTGLSKHRTWLMVAEMRPNATGMGMTLLCTRRHPLAERRWTSWGADRLHNLQRGEGYEYRLTPLGADVLAALQQNDEGEGRDG